MGQAFDLAWKDVEHVFTTPEMKEAARLCLAQGILANAQENSRNVEELRLQGHAALVRQFANELVKARRLT
jgi:hypothetical protein